ncbi:DNA-binding protein [Salipiger aestuarii]|uniref:DNA-binding protein H-NS n=1 Tax=Salipiger aestuarii TaxID=568098 RepID=A0A327YU62_9RHOB|nr:H-NS histone family protein [Salipiger aestuarii]EIE51185.1 trans-acting regulatory protein HvrA [Citreicella sp. 357]KAA8603510.1 DNA-binding protein [Salipiger aestuarii]KAA8607258.1 DNA-binding protein [Salipiger aestuarii]KAB2538421.1 DNA-binding protein [Salipiger aestuarii]RAK23916.1 DNA-binding protein H-NS [Salipiger aestuarii]
MEVNLEALSKDELKKLRADVDRALNTLETRRKADAKRAAEQAVKEFGFSLDEVLTAGSAKGSKGAPKYANPANPSQTWTGRGRKPNWLNDALASGKTLDDLAI